MAPVDGETRPGATAIPVSGHQHGLGRLRAGSIVLVALASSAAVLAAVDVIVFLPQNRIGFADGSLA